jgi:hypothetical protein
VVLALVAILTPSIASAQDAISGTWRGKSSCMDRQSACRDEAVVYRFSPLENRPGTFSVSADKMVNGKAVNMGTLEFRYIEDQHALVCQYGQGVWRLNVNGEKIEGTLTRLDKSIFRRVTLRKE